MNTRTLYCISKNYPRKRKDGGGEYTDKKEKKVFFIYVLGNSEGSDAKSYMTNDPLIYDENMCAFPHLLGSPSSYMTYITPDPYI